MKVAGRILELKRRIAAIERQNAKLRAALQKSRGRLRQARRPVECAERARHVDHDGKRCVGRGVMRTKKRSLRQCSVPGCPGLYEAKGFCTRHYQQIKKYGRITSVEISRNNPNEIITFGETTWVITRTSRGVFRKIILISTCDIEKISKYKWHFDGRYAKSQQGIYLHRLIAGEWEREVDHINRDTTDNRRTNLRAVTRRQNAWNVSGRKRGASGFIGVYKHMTKSGLKWRARISYNKKGFWLGSYKTPEDAAAAYDAAVIELRGENFAVTNESLGLINKKSAPDT